MGQTGRGLLAKTRLLFCVNDASGQVNFRACLPRIAIVSTFRESKSNS